MDPLTFEYRDLHARTDRGVFELFDLSRSGETFRVPLEWLGVLVHFKKPGKPGQLFVGVVRDSASPLYGTDRLDFRFAGTQLEVPEADEASFRAYFSQVAELAGRRVN
jgi:hypothetical protein